MAGGDSFDAVIALVVSSSSSSDQSVPGPPVRFFVRPPGRGVGGHLPCLPRHHHSHPPTRPQLISDALAGKRTRLGSYKLPVGAATAVWWSVNMLLGGSAINILKAVSSHCNHSAPLTDCTARSNCTRVTGTATSPRRRRTLSRIHLCQSPFSAGR